MATTEFHFVEHVTALAFEEGLAESPATLAEFLAQRYEGLSMRAVPWPDDATGDVWREGGLSELVNNPALAYGLVNNMRCVAAQSTPGYEWAVYQEGWRDADPDHPRLFIVARPDFEAPEFSAVFEFDGTDVFRR